MGIPNWGICRIGIGSFLLLLNLWGCGGEEIDREDELGTSQEEEDANGYELVILDPPEKKEELADSSKKVLSQEIPDAYPSAEKEEEGEETLTPVVFSPKGEFTVQIGSFLKSGDASALVRQLSGEGYPAYAVASPDGKGTRVRIGYFKTREDARRFGTIFKKDRDLDFWVDSRENEKF
jgi:hypothetical protein